MHKRGVIVVALIFNDLSILIHRAHCYDALLMKSTRFRVFLLQIFHALPLEKSTVLKEHTK